MPMLLGSERQRATGYVPVEKKRQLLLDASRRYVAGDIDFDTYKQVERANMPDFTRVMLGLAKPKSSPQRQGLKRFWIRLLTSRV